MGSLEELYERLQEKFDIEEVTEDDLRRWIYNGRTGPKSTYSKGSRGGVVRPRIDAERYRSYRGTKALEDSDIDDFMAAPRMFKSEVGNPNDLSYSGKWKDAVVAKFAGIENIEKAAVDTEQLGESGDLKGIRDYARRIGDKDQTVFDETVGSSTNVTENAFYNYTTTTITRLGKSRDIEGLRSLKDVVRDSRDELELLEEIDAAINKIS